MISVVIPIYNREKYLQQCLQSVLRQPYTDLEVLCIDDGSKDHSCEIVRKIASYDKRVRLICQNHGGAGAARNNGIYHASGEWVAFLDSDDVWVKDTVTDELLNKIDSSRDIVRFGCYHGDQCLRRGNYYELCDGIVNAKKADYGNHSSYWFKKDFLLKNKIKTDQYTFYEDWRFLIQCYGYTDIIQTVSVPLFIYRFNLNSLTHCGSSEEEILKSSLEGFYRLAKKTENTYIREQCESWIVTHFIDLAKVLSVKPDAESLIRMYDEKYHFSELIRRIWISEQDKLVCNDIEHHIEIFIKKSKKLQRKKAIKVKISNIKWLQKIYHKLMAKSRYKMDIGECLYAR